MKTEQIEHILAINQFGSISAAAKELYLSQTTLSAAVKSVEEEMGFPLFVRTYSGVSPTAEGKEALAIMKEIDRCIEEIRMLRDSAVYQYQTVRVITSPTIQSALSLALNQIVEREIPECSLEFEIVVGEEVGKLLARNKGNIGITYMKESSYADFKAISSKYRIKMERLLEDHFYLLVRKDHPLAVYDRISPKMITGMEMAMLENYSTNANSLISRESLGAGNRYTTFSSIALIKRFILTRNAGGILTGYAIHCNQSVNSSLMKPILLTDLERPNDFTLYLLSRVAGDLTPHESTMVNNIRSYFKQVGPEVENLI